MSTRPLTDAQCKATLMALIAAEGNQSAAARTLHLNHQTFKHRVWEAKERFPELYTEPVDGRPKKKQRTTAEEIVQHRTKESDKAKDAKIRDLLKLNAALEEKLKDLEGSLVGAYKPAEWTLPSRQPKKREHTPYLLTSDAQIGEVIRAEETEAGYGYNSEIYRRRHRHLISTVIYLSFDHAGHDWKYPGIIYARDGDTISGGIHEELRDTDDLTPIQAIECAFEEESAGIEKLAEAFGRVDVKAPGAAGNHDRTTFKPRTKGADTHSYDRTINYMLRHHFRHDKRVTFQVSQSYDVRFPIYARQILLTHGDRIGSRGGQGMIGPMATILRGAQKVIMEQAALGFHVDEVHHGHFHTPGFNDWVVSNGCYPGYSEFAKSFRMRPSPPMQQLLYYHPKRGVVDHKPIVLTEA